MARAPKLTLFLFLLAAVAGAAMVDPAADPDVRPFTYFAKPTTVIGVQDGPEGTQVTWEGSLWTGQAELLWLVGEPLTPVCCRIKTLDGGHFPIVCYGLDRDGIRYDFTAFAATLDGQPTSPLDNFVRVTVRNTTQARRRAIVAAATRHSTGDHRAIRPAAFLPIWRYEMTDGAALRHGKVVYLFPPGATRLAAVDVPYIKPFAGQDHAILPETPTCIARYTVELAAGGSRAFDFKMPYTPFASADTKRLDALRKASFDDHLERTRDHWRKLFDRCAQFVVPERKVTDTARASLAYVLIARDKIGENYVQKVNEFQYDAFWLRDSSFFVRAYDLLGLHDIAEQTVSYFSRYQRPDGNFISQGGQLDGFGQALWALGAHYQVTRDRAYAERVYPHFPKAIGWLHEAREKDEYGVMPKTNAHDAEVIIGRYTGHNFWALLGLRHAIGMAKALGKTDDLKRFQAEWDDYLATFRKRLDAAATKFGGPTRTIPPGLDVPGGQDWGNLIGVYPSGVLDPHDPLVTATLKDRRATKYREGLMTYSNASALHHYLTTYLTQTHVIRGEQELALRDLYALLVHTSSTHAGFEWSIRPWSNRDPGRNFPPHGWFAVRYIALLRNMLVREQGDDLHLFSVLSPHWIEEGQEVRIESAPTDFGTVSAQLRFHNEGARLELTTRLHTVPKRCFVHIPWFCHVDGATQDNRQLTLDKGAVAIDPTGGPVEFRGGTLDVEPMSYEGALSDYKREYARRYREQAAKGAEPYDLSVPQPRPLAQRREQFERRYAALLGKGGVAIGKPTTNSCVVYDHGSDQAVDGVVEPRNGWWAEPNPNWMQIDLQKTHRIDRVHLYTYWLDKRHYQYRIDVSTDGKAWKTVADRARSTRLSTKDGEELRFAAAEARYIKLTILKNSANPACHVVELMVFEAGK